jgi:hypothetical protein
MPTLPEWLRRLVDRITAPPAPAPHHPFSAPLKLTRIPRIRLEQKFPDAWPAAMPPATTRSAGLKAPVTVRGDGWRNTADEQHALPLRMETVDDSSLAGLIQGLATRNRVAVRLASAQSLGQLGPLARPALPNLIQAAVELDPRVRNAAAAALSAVDPAWAASADARQEVPALVETLQSTTAERAEAAAALLAQIAPHAVAAFGAALAQAQDAITQVSLLHILQQLGPAAAVALPQIHLALQSSFMQSRLAAARCLARVGPDPETSLPLLHRGLSDPYAEVREAMAQAILPLLHHPDAAVRAAAAALAKRG